MKYEKPKVEMLTILLQDVVTVSRDGKIEAGDPKTDEPNGAFGGLV